MTGVTILQSVSNYGLFDILAIFSKNPLVRHLLSLFLNHVKHLGKIVFVWTPGHFDILDDDQADEAARHATKEDSLSPPLKS